MSSAGLSQRANHPASNLEAVHGSLFDIRCSSSQCAFAKKDDFTDPAVPALAISEDHDLSSTKFPLKSIVRSDLPRCPKCQSLLRPGVVWFGEPLPMRAIDRIHNWLDGGKVDLMLVIGTSSTVWPAANYIHAELESLELGSRFSTWRIRTQMVGSVKRERRTGSSEAMRETLYQN